MCARKYSKSAVKIKNDVHVSRFSGTTGTHITQGMGQSYDYPIAEKQPRASIHYAGVRLTVRSLEASKPRDSDSDFSNRSKISQACQLSGR